MIGGFDVVLVLSWAEFGVMLIGGVHVISVVERAVDV